MRLQLRRALTPLGDFLQTEAASGIALLAATAAALAWANSPAAAGYDALWHIPLGLEAGPFALELDLRHWINEGLMTLFFFVIGLEIKRELVEGELQEPRQAVLPVAGALGGMLVPALIYFALNSSGSGAAGWGIPMATDIAFAVGVLSLFGPRVPPSLRVFLLSLAIVDDIGAILVVAFFYSGGIALEPLLLFAASVGVFALLWRSNGRAPAVFRLAAAALAWLALHDSGVHAAIAGAADPIRTLEALLHPWTSYLILPLFDLANAGVAISPDTVLDALLSPVGGGVALGLVIGKLVGITGAVALVTRTSLAKMPENVSLPALAATAATAGIGFTVSLFIGALAFPEDGFIDVAKIGTLAGSLVSAMVGASLLGLTLPRRTHGGSVAEASTVRHSGSL